MTEIADLTVDQLAAGLRSWASGVAAQEAAIELLVGHRAWLHRGDFVAAALRTAERSPLDGSAGPVVGIDWDKAGRFAERVKTQGTDIAILRLALGLAGRAVAPPLGELLAGLDQAGTTLVLHAIAHAAGWQERGTVALVTGGFRALSTL